MRVFFANTEEFVCNLIYQNILYFARGDFNVKRFNDLDIIKNLTISISDSESKIILSNSKGEITLNKDLQAAFLRRSKISFDPNYFRSSIHQINDFSLREVEELNQFIFYFLGDVVSLQGSYRDEYKVDKLKQLYEATKVGLKVPKTIITTNKKDVISFKNNLNSDLIIKPITNQFKFEFEGDAWSSSGTQVFDKDDLGNLPDVFFPTLFQEMINKKFEIRVFFYEQKFWAMAIFSQKNEKTKIDFRNYDDENPNRCVPYYLDSELLHKIKNLIKTLNYKTGSIDIIKSENDFIFLEINLSGQFTMVSRPCNYYIEEHIAKSILKYENGEKY
jgi:ATP-GRASP peptide maturase of grasp-with-spasm system